MTIHGELKTWIRDAARRLGFELCGFAPPQIDPEDRARFLEWLARGYHGEMAYLEKPRRLDLASVLPGVRSVISVGMVYNTAHPLSVDSSDPARGWISRYAWGQDYHAILQERLEQLLDALRERLGQPFQAKVYADTGPVLERAVAQAAGLGWLAKNTCLINEGVGSWFFLGEILTDLECEPDAPAWDRCGTCTRCLEACPTGAIVEPYALDATRCISYHTIELKGAILEEFRPGIGRHVFGCDICQDVCPWNHQVPVSPLPQFEPRPLSAFSAEQERGGNAAAGDAVPLQRRPDAEAHSLSHSDAKSSSLGDRPEGELTAFEPPLEFLASLSEPEFFQAFRNSPLRRARHRGFLRNVAVAMGNSGEPKFRPVLERLATHSEPVVRQHALWALGQLP